MRSFSLRIPFWQLLLWLGHGVGGLLLANAFYRSMRSSSGFWESLPARTVRPRYAVAIWPGKY
jgi:hypothetical protein